MQSEGGGVAPVVGDEVAAEIAVGKDGDVVGAVRRSGNESIGGEEGSGRVDEAGMGSGVATEARVDVAMRILDAVPHYEDPTFAIRREVQVRLGNAGRLVHPHQLTRGGVGSSDMDDGDVRGLLGGTAGGIGAGDAAGGPAHQIAPVAPLHDGAELSRALSPVGHLR